MHFATPAYRGKALPECVSVGDKDRRERSYWAQRRGRYPAISVKGFSYIPEPSVHLVTPPRSYATIVLDADFHQFSRRDVAGQLLGAALCLFNAIRRNSRQISLGFTREDPMMRSANLPPIFSRSRTSSQLAPPEFLGRGESLKCLSTEIVRIFEPEERN
ncbi:hypothetical protein KM043_007963 [Ampulex compressa]|nr:hypothetical protein KM043_007963 [Ampulex compressa]